LSLLHLRKECIIVMFRPVHSRRNAFISLVVLVPLIVELVVGLGVTHAQSASTIPNTMNQAFNTASQQFGVPAPLLEAICDMEGQLSEHDGQPSIDNGYGCMHLVKNDRVDTLDEAAKDLNVSSDQLKSDMATNILGGAAVLHDIALQLSGNNSLPTSLADWYPVIEKYSGATTQSTAVMYANALYKILNAGFSGQANDGETITLNPQSVTPNAAVASHFPFLATTNLPQDCTNDGKTDYPGAIDCILNPNLFKCTLDPYLNGQCAYNCVLTPAVDNNCTYTPANRPSDTPIHFIIIHDIEGTLEDGLNTFQDPTSQRGVHYVIDSDGTVYQLIHDKDITYDAANFLYNDQGIAIDHVGIDATGYTWFNAAEYLGSAKLVAWLISKYNLPLDHDHIIGHGLVSADSLLSSPNHVDPGPYWLWDYYFNLIRQYATTPTLLANGLKASLANTITLRPVSGFMPLGRPGHESKSRNFNFFHLYQGSSTKSGLVPNASTTDITDETSNVESDITYYYLAKKKDPDSPDTMYAIWYGELNQLNNSALSYPDNEIADAKLAWLAVPPGAGWEGLGTGQLVSLPMGAKIYGHPNALTDDNFLIGYVCSGPGGDISDCNTPNHQAVFVSTLHYSAAELQPNPVEVQDDAVASDVAPTTDWYEINFNHRQAWVPASEVTLVG
jgi:N-acetyl-anhydromuramyl-L-alanine amidase AmpD